MSLASSAYACSGLACLAAALFIGTRCCGPCRRQIPRRLTTAPGCAGGHAARRFGAGLGRNLALRQLGREPDFDVHRRVVRLSKNPCGHAAARPGAGGGGEHRRLERRRRRRLRRTTCRSDGCRRWARCRVLSRGGLCSAIVAVAQANDLPIPFFANLIWQESSFRSRTDQPGRRARHRAVHPGNRGRTRTDESVRAGACAVRGRETAAQAQRAVRQSRACRGRLQRRAAAREDWMAERRTLPSETRAYVIRITGRPADQWLSSEIRNDPEATLMPARAPCAEVDEEVRAQARIVRVSQADVGACRRHGVTVAGDRAISRCRARI